MRPYELITLPLLWLLSAYGLARWQAAPRRSRVLTVMWGTWTLAVTLGTPAVRRVTDALIGIASITNLLVHVVGLVGTAAVIEFVREITGRARGRVSPLNMYVLAAQSFILAVVFALMPRPDGEVDLLTYGQKSVAGFAYWTLLTSFTAFGVAVAARVCWAHGKQVAPGPARTVMWLLKSAFLADAVYLVHRLVYVTAQQLGWRVPQSAVVVTVTQALLGLTWVLFGLAVFWPGFAEFRYKRAVVVQQKRIMPLWRLLQAATPGVVLPLPDELRRGNPRLRLYRYVIEIQDGILALEAHLNSGHQARAEAALRQVGVDEAHIAPAAEAALLRYASQASLDMRDPAPGRRLQVRRESDALDAEIAWFARVSAALDRPEVLRTARDLSPGTPRRAGRQSEAH
ncbi:MAB_1171c family putative transporter [Streptomyces tanashiensis]|uniref:MAB_1171c family putative transporter n=1 Tax=Streptomyces tanashiensis TaxID=67367 RepID=UPI00340B96E0